MTRLRSYTLDLNPPSDFGPLKNQYEETVKNILNESSRIAKRANITSKDEMHIVLLTEEMISVLPHLIEYGSGKFWIDVTDDLFEMYLQVTPKASGGAKARMVSGPAKKTIMGRVLGAFDKVVNRKNDRSAGDETSWSLGSYIEKLKQQDPGSTRDEWDEMEHSILAKIADDVIVRWEDKSVDLVITKKVSPRDPIA